MGSDRKAFINKHACKVILFVFLVLSWDRKTRLKAKTGGAWEGRVENSKGLFSHWRARGCEVDRQMMYMS